MAKKKKPWVRKRHVFFKKLLHISFNIPMKIKYGYKYEKFKIKKGCETHPFYLLIYFKVFPVKQRTIHKLSKRHIKPSSKFINGRQSHRFVLPV